jgi:chromosome segregation ATPase
MDKEGLQRQIDDMEEAAQRWRAERRRLNAEIDKLEAELADAKAAAAKKRATDKADAKNASSDVAAAAKLQQAAEEKLKSASEGWETERGQLKSQINRLEGAVADAIARASNPMRATQSVKDQFEAELSRVAKEKTEIEQSFLRAKTEWEQEKLKLAGDMVKLRRSTQAMGRPVPKEDAPEANPKVRDLENQLRESLNKWNAEREQMVGQIHKLEEAARLWDSERRQLNDHAGQLQQAFLKAQASIQSLEVAARAPNPSDHKLEQIKQEKEDLEDRFQAAQDAWDAARRRLEEQLQRTSENRDRVSSEVVDQLRQQYEDRLQEAIRQKTELAKELQTASSTLESERQRLAAAHEHTPSQMDTAHITAEVKRVEGLIEQIVKIIDNPDTELATIIRKNVEKAELDSYLKGILFSIGKK